MAAPSGESRSAIYVPVADGTRRRIEGTGVIAAFGDGRELHISFSRHPASEGGVTLRSEYLAPGAAPVPPGPGRPLPEVFACILIRPGGGNLMHVSVDVRASSGGETIIEAGAVAPRPHLLVTVDDARASIDSSTAVMDLDCGGDLEVSIGTEPPGAASGPRGSVPLGWIRLLAGPVMTPAEYESMRTGGAFATSSLLVEFGAANVVHVVVDRREGVRLPPDWPRPPALSGT